MSYNMITHHHFSELPEENSVIASYDISGLIENNSTSMIKQVLDPIPRDVLALPKLRNIGKWLKTLHYISGRSKYNTPITRSQLFFHTNGDYFSSDWNIAQHSRWTSQPMVPLMEELINNFNTIGRSIHQDVVSRCSHINANPNRMLMSDWKTFNSCQINRYLNGNEHIPRHSDNQSNFGKDPFIMIWSIGCQRTMNFYRLIYNPERPRSQKIDTSYSPITIQLKENTVLIMAGTTQRHFLHEIPPDPSCTESRYSLTFRAHNQNNQETVYSNA